jgi:bilin biosynthesis protein
MTNSRRDPVNGAAERQRMIAILAGFHSFEPGARERAFRELLGLDREQAIEVLATLLEHPDLNLRCDAAEALFRIEPVRASDIVLPLLNDPSRIVRGHVCGLLQDFGDNRRTPELVATLERDPDGKVRCAAAWALGEIGDTRALPSLREAARLDEGTDGDGRTVRAAAVEAIERIMSRQRGMGDTGG